MLEIIATISGLLCVILVVKQNVWNWAFGLIQVLLYTYIFFGAKLYSDTILQVIWIPLQIYGFIQWRNGTKDSTLTVTSLTAQENTNWWVIGAIGSLLIGYIMKTYTQAAAPFVDSIVLSLSLVANYLLTKKKIENWYFWFVIDVISIGLFAYKGLYFTAGLYAVYIGLVIVGFIQWRKDIQCQPALA